jgi:hypothetical protein
MTDEQKETLETLEDFIEGCSMNGLCDNTINDLASEYWNESGCEVYYHGIWMGDFQRWANDEEICDFIKWANNL